MTDLSSEGSKHFNDVNDFLSGSSIFLTSTIKGTIMLVSVSLQFLEAIWNMPTEATPENAINREIQVIPSLTIHPINFY